MRVTPDFSAHGPSQAVVDLFKLPCSITSSSLIHVSVAHDCSNKKWSGHQNGISNGSGDFGGSSAKIKCE